MRKMIAGLVALAFMASFVPSYADDLEKSLEDLGTKLAAQLSRKGVKKVAVDGFTDLNGYKSTLGDFIAEELTTTLIANGGLEVVERRELDRVLSELSTYTDGTFDPSTTAELQKLLGIDALITGSIANLGNRVKINARGIGVETAQSYAAGSVSLVKDETISYLLDQVSSSDNRGGGVQSPDAFFKNESIHVVPKVVTISSDKKRLKIVAEFRNTSGKDILVAHYQRNSRAVSDAGDTFGRAILDGIPSISRSGTRRADRYTTIKAGSHATVVWEYKIDAPGISSIMGSSFTVVIEVYQWLASGPKSYAVELRNLRP